MFGFIFGGLYIVARAILRLSEMNEIAKNSSLNSDVQYQSDQI